MSEETPDNIQYHSRIPRAVYDEFKSNQFTEECRSTNEQMIKAMIQQNDKNRKLKAKG